MIDKAHDLPLSRQAKVLSISRGSVYYKPRPVSPEDVALMRTWRSCGGLACCRFDGHAVKLTQLRSRTQQG